MNGILPDNIKIIDMDISSHVNIFPQINMNKLIDTNIFLSDINKNVITKESTNELNFNSRCF